MTAAARPITYDRARLRESLAKLSPPARAAASAYFTERALPKLTDDRWTPEWLAEVVPGLAEAIAGAGFVAFTPPIDTAPLIARIAELPDDLADYAAEEVYPHEVPNVRHADRWTEDHYRVVDEVLSHVEAMYGARHRSLMASLRAAGIEEGDHRHKLIGLATGGRTTSSKAVTGPEAAHIAAWCDARVAQRAETGGFPPTEPYEPDWKAEAKAQGVTQADLLKRAKDWATRRSLAVPRKLTDVTDYRAIAALLFRATDGKSASAEADAELAKAHAAVAAEPSPPQVEPERPALTVVPDLPVNPTIPEGEVDPTTGGEEPNPQVEVEGSGNVTTLTLARRRMVTDVLADARRQLTDPEHLVLLEVIAALTGEIVDRLAPA